MGWCTGSSIAEDLYKDIRKHLPEDKRKLVAKKIYNIFCDNDADCWDDAMKLIKDGEINLDE